jgi:hypothetical protein
MTRKQKSRHITYYKKLIYQAETIKPKLNNYMGICLFCISCFSSNDVELLKISRELGSKFPINKRLNYYSLYGDYVRGTEEWRIQREDLLNMIISECEKQIKRIEKLP